MNDAVVDRKVEMPADVEKEQIMLIVKTGLSQGLNKKEFRELLDQLEVRFIRKPPVYIVGAPDDFNAHHGGQADVVKFLRNVCGGIKYGE